MFSTQPAPASYAAEPDHGGQEPGSHSFAPPILLQYLHVAMRWKWVIGGIVLASLALGLIATLMMTPQYTAKTRIEISRDQKKITKVEGLESTEASRDLEFYQTQYSLLSARSLAERVSRKLRLSTNDEFLRAHGVDPEAGDGLFGKSGGAMRAEERRKREEMVVDLLLDHVGIAPVRGSSLVDIHYTSASADLSAQIANMWTREFMQSSMDRRFDSTADARSFLEGRLSDLRNRLETSERDLVNYASRNGIVALGKSKSVDGKTEVDRTLVSSDLEALNEALAKATAERIAAQSRAGQSSGGGANAEALENIAISSLRQKRAEVAADYARLMVQFEPEYPAARALAVQLRALDTSIAREEQRVQSSRTSEYGEAVEREERLRAQVEELKALMDGQQRASIQYNIYQREADTNRQLYDALLQRYKEIGVAGVGANNIAIVDTAIVPRKPSSPRLLLNLALSLLAGLMLAAGATFALEQIDEGLRDPAQVSRLLNIPLLGSVPDVENEDALAALDDSKSALSEAYLSIRSNLAFSTDHGVPRSLMVTSTRPAEGKSTTSIAIAKVLSRTGRRVLIVDADMRSPSMHEYLGGKNKAGLSNLLAGDNDWQALVRDSNTKGLSLLSAGPMPPSAAELLSSERMSVLIRQMQEHFEHIVVDAPPILGLADAPLLARAVEGCVFVVEAEGVAVRGIRASLERLRSVQAHIVGAVLTKLHARRASYGYGYGYGHSYGYGKDQAD